MRLPLSRSSVDVVVDGDGECARQSLWREDTME
jgi:hypothetical protein